MRGVPCLADVQHVLIADVEPVDRETELRVVAVAKAEVLAKPVARALRIVGQYQHMLEKFDTHFLCSLFADLVFRFWPGRSRPS